VSRSHVVTSQRHAAELREDPFAYGAADASLELRVGLVESDFDDQAAAALDQCCRVSRTPGCDEVVVAQMEAVARRVSRAGRADWIRRRGQQVDRRIARMASASKSHFTEAAMHSHVGFAEMVVRQLVVRRHGHPSSLPPGKQVERASKVERRGIVQPHRV
jgi:hypothetical protein